MLARTKSISAVAHKHKSGKHDLLSGTCIPTHRTSEPASASFCLRKALRCEAASSAAELGIWDALFSC